MSVLLPQYFDLDGSGRYCMQDCATLHGAKPILNDFGQKKCGLSVLIISILCTSSFCLLLIKFHKSVNSLKDTLLRASYRNLNCEGLSIVIGATVSYAILAINDVLNWRE